MQRFLTLSILIICLIPTLSFGQKVVERYENGQKKYQGRTKDNVNIGTHTYWHENGEKCKEEKYNDLGALLRLREWDESGELTKDERPEEALEILRREQFQNMRWIAKDGISFHKLRGKNDLQQKTDHQRLVIHYATYLENGKEIDNTFRKKVPLPVDIKARSLIEGFIRGLSYFELKDNGYIKVPYDLAYGKDGATGVPGYSTIYFHVLVLRAE